MRSYPSAADESGGFKTARGGLNITELIVLTASPDRPQSSLPFSQVVRFPPLNTTVDNRDDLSNRMPLSDLPTKGESHLPKLMGL